jgi:hypothetical protein
MVGPAAWGATALGCSFFLHSTFAAYLQLLGGNTWQAAGPPAGEISLFLLQFLCLRAQRA